MNAPAQNLATREPSPMIELKHELEKRTESFRMALPSHIKPEDLQRTVLMAAQQNPTILQADRRSLILSCMKAAQDGLLPDGREAALVPFNTREKDGQGKWISVKQVQYMPMVYGLRKKIMQSDEISVMQVGVVYRAEYESGRFLYELGMEPPVRYRPDLALSDEETADENIVAAFSLVKFKDGSWSAEVMRRSEIDKIRQLSQTGAIGQTVKFGANKGKAIDPKGPWVDHFAEMAKKTVMRRHSKVLPMSGDIFRDVEGDEIDRAARSAVAALDAVEPDAPVALPSNDELDQDDQHDPETGEVRDSRGMTEVDEETARKLDAGETDDDEAETEGKPEQDEQAGESVSDEMLRKVREQIAAAKNVKGLAAVEQEWVNKHRIAFDDETAGAVDKEFAERRKVLQGGEKGE
ncbi:recombinase RecT [Croceibacterium aestuarii]|uniref:recombinase RecT n=1 Tax=Croceibacterium aestuarii TaxID=3064139 RepID=UPI00272DFF9A|nr:recombinase RecT [Croceibacterium sp. D39]